MLKSLPSVDVIVVNFTNISNKVVDVVWFDFKGMMVRYCILHPGDTKKVSTYSGHTWKSFQHETACEMSLDGQPVFYASTMDRSLRVLRINGRLRHYRPAPVLISPPFSSLSDLCQYEIIQRVCSDKDIDSLDLPQLLKQSLKLIWLRKNKHLHYLKDYYDTIGNHRRTE